MIRKRESLNVADESARRAGKRSCRWVRAGQPLGCTAYFVFRVIADLRMVEQRIVEPVQFGRDLAANNGPKAVGVG